MRQTSITAPSPPVTKYSGQRSNAAHGWESPNSTTSLTLSPDASARTVWWSYSARTVPRTPGFSRPAAALDVHPDTFRYRLRRAAQIAGLDLDDPDARFAAMLEFRLTRRRPSDGAEHG